MFSLRKITGNTSSVLITIFLLAVIIVTLPALITTTGTNRVYGQPDQMNSTVADSSPNIQNIPVEKIVQVGDIEIAYKMSGKGDPILLISGGSADKNAWDPSFIRDLSSNHTVIVFDTRGVGNTTIGSKPYTMEQLANDTAGLLDALKIQNANVLGYSLGSYIAEQLTITNPEKVNRLILAGASCGGKDGIPKPPEFLKLQSEIVNKISNNVTISREENIALANASLGAGWIRLHPESLENITEGIGFFANISPEAQEGQANLGFAWEATNWNGACDELAKTAKPTLVITGTDDNFYQPHVNSLKIVEKIPGAWLVQIENAGHAVMDQYPDEISKILQTFLSTTTTTTAQP
ncbi:MAG: bpoC 7 [Nitrososphaeraceae archaeon]|jgi:pimeloyl-ACP methyl ester carboxylesterase|nr:bpoC 7 [Nitrososphaeraceae archaeon]MCD6036542.1 bpoC 7 [Nitrososphaeraceae archaeon]MDF2767913.1 bpoC 7 [Nitrososphaeraceae archaeon]